jgi:hypothetical protein
MSADESVLNPNAVRDATISDLTADQDARARKANADALRSQIESLKQGRPPRSLNEFVEQQMAEDTKTGRRSTE